MFPLLFSAAPGPNAHMSRSLEETMMKEAVRYQKSHAPSELTPMRLAILGMLFLACLIAPIIFGKHVWKNGQVSLITTAAKNGELSRVKELVTADPTLVNAPGYLGRPALFWAAATDHTEIAKYLLENKAQIDMGDQRGWTPLFAAARYDKRSMAEFLLTHKATLITKDKQGRTALHTAAQFGSVKTGEFLIGAGLNVNAKDNDGWTALHVAAQHRQIKMVASLIENGADMNAKTSGDETPLHVANSLKHNDEVIEFLVNRGAAE